VREDKRVLLCLPGSKVISWVNVVPIEGDEQLTDSGVLEDNQEARIIDPLNLKPSADVFPLYESRLNVSRLQLLREAGKRENTCDASRELGE